MTKAVSPVYLMIRGIQFRIDLDACLRISKPEASLAIDSRSEQTSETVY